MLKNTNFTENTQQEQKRVEHELKKRVVGDLTRSTIIYVKKTKLLKSAENFFAQR